MVFFLVRKIPPFLKCIFITLFLLFGGKEIKSQVIDTLYIKFEFQEKDLNVYVKSNLEEKVGREIYLVGGNLFCVGLNEFLLFNNGQYNYTSSVALYEDTLQVYNFVSLIALFGAVVDSTIEVCKVGKDWNFLVSLTRKEYFPVWLRVNYMNQIQPFVYSYLGDANLFRPFHIYIVEYYWLTSLIRTNVYNNNGRLLQTTNRYNILGQRIKSN